MKISRFSPFEKKGIVIIVLFLFVTLLLNFLQRGDSHFTYLAEAFIGGKTYFLDNRLPLDDTVFFANHQYWPLGPFPAVFILPGVLLFNVFGGVFYQGCLQFFLIWISFILIYKISLRIGYTKKESMYTAIAFCFASPFLGVALVPASWYFAQVITVFLLFLIIYEHLNKQRIWLVGVLYSLVLATRATAFLSIIFFVIYLLSSNRKSVQQKAVSVFRLLAPSLFVLGFLLVYNLTRFGNIFEQGYNYQNIHPQLVALRDIGLFNMRHVPSNLYYLLAKFPEPVNATGNFLSFKFPFVTPNVWGMSIFVTSPYFLALFILDYKDKISKAILIACLAVLVPILFYYGIGFMQYGYRYALDFLPFLYYLLLRNYQLKYKKLPAKVGLFVTVLVLVNIYLVSVFEYEVLQYAY
jgi:hypothetical protein